MNHVMSFADRQRDQLLCCARRGIPECGACKDINGCVKRHMAESEWANVVSTNARVTQLNAVKSKDRHAYRPANSRT